MNQLIIDDAVERVRAALETGRVDDAISYLNTLHPADRAETFADLETEDQHELLPRMDAESTAEILEELEDEDALAATTHLSSAQLADVLDETMVADGLISPHPKFAVSPTSGYRLLEHAYAEILQNLPADLVAQVPVWDQIYLEQFHSGYVASLDLAAWDKLLNLETAEEN